jgi:uncharacterized protein (TIGR00251 family)
VPRLRRPPRSRPPAPSPGEGPEGLDLRDVPGGIGLRVRVQPRSSRDAVGGAREGALLVRLTAPPVEGAANAALARLLGRTLGVPPSAVRIVGGATGRAKRVAIAGVDLATARERLGGLAAGRSRSGSSGRRSDR